MVNPIDSEIPFTIIIVVWLPLTKKWSCKGSAHCIKELSKPRLMVTTKQSPLSSLASRRATQGTKNSSISTF